MRLKPDSTSIGPDPDAIRPEPDSIRLKPDSAQIALESDPRPIEAPRMTYEAPLFASASEEPRRRSGLSLWFAAAASLVLGIVIGFASGYRAGQGSSVIPAAVDGPAPTSGSASPGQPFSESPVSDPVRLEPEEIVPAPSDKPSAETPSASPRPAPASPPAQQAAPKPTVNPRPAPVTPGPRPAAPRQVTPPAVENEPRLPAGPGSLQVVSRPPGAEVIVDGTSVGRTPLSIEVSPGQHTVRLALPGFNGWQTTVDVKPGSSMRVSGSLEQ